MSQQQPQLHKALEAIRGLPSVYDLLTNPVARAMYEIAAHTLEDVARHMVVIEEGGGEHARKGEN